VFTLNFSTPDIIKNMSVNKLLLWEKWRPKKIEDIILLPRIKKHFEGEINGNYIFHGHFGTGKTSLSRILIGKYLGDKPFLELNSSYSTSIDVLRSEIDDFCKFTPMMSSDSDIKWVFLDEFDRTSAQFQDAFKAFIEKYSKNVRFILTTNHINKIDGGIKSRIPQINFDCLNTDEERFLKQEIFKKIRDVILPSEGIEISKEDLVKIINKNFPDFRSIIEAVSVWIKTGEVNKNEVDVELQQRLFSVIYDNVDYETVYHFVMREFGPEKIDTLFNLLGRPFIDWSIKSNKNIDKLFNCNSIVADYHHKLEGSTDPVILGMTVIGKFREILN
jgi:DNA polymerase III delta prime subunit